MKLVELTSSKLTNLFKLVSNLKSFESRARSVYVSVTPILRAFPTSFQSFSYFSGSEVAILVKRSRDFLMRVR